MRISDLEFYLVEVPTVGWPGRFRSLLVRLEIESGLQGWGEAAVAWRPGELAARRDLLLPVLSGRNVFQVEDLLSLDALEQPPLAAALEMASWDLIGQLLQQPLCNLWGGEFRRHIPVCLRIALRDHQAVVQLAREMAEQGFHHQVIAPSDEEEVPIEIDAMLNTCETLIDRVEVGVDARGRLDPVMISDITRSFEQAGVAFLVDPFSDRDLGKLAAVRRQTHLPLGVAEQIRDAQDVMAVARSGAASLVVLQMDRLGGLAATSRCAAVAKAAGMTVAVSIASSAGIAVAAGVQLAACTPSLDSPNHMSYQLVREDLLLEPLDAIDGMLAVPRLPGLGVQVDRAKLEAFQID